MATQNLHRMRHRLHHLHLITLHSISLILLIHPPPTSIHALSSITIDPIIPTILTVRALQLTDHCDSPNLGPWQDQGRDHDRGEEIHHDPMQGVGANIAKAVALSLLSS